MNRAERQRRTAEMARCEGCGQIARRGSTLCGACSGERDEAARLRDALWACESLHDLQNFIEEEILPKLS